MKKTGAFFASLAALGLMWSVSAEAGQFRLGHKFDNVQISQNYGEGDGYGDSSYSVSPSEAASIAKGSWPGSKVLRVQLLPSGVYAVTLKQVAKCRESWLMPPRAKSADKLRCAA